LISKTPFTALRAAIYRAGAGQGRAGHGRAGSSKDKTQTRNNSVGHRSCDSKHKDARLAGQCLTTMGFRE